MKIKSFIVIILIIVINMIFFNINKVQASSISDVIKGGDNFIASGKHGSVTVDGTKLETVSSSIYNVLLVVGMCAAVAISGILGIKFMIGSVDEKAQIKDALVPFVIGCVVIFGAFGIWKIFVTFGNDLGGEQSSGVTSDHVTDEDGNKYIKGKLYHTCGHIMGNVELMDGRCSQCKIPFETKCICTNGFSVDEYIKGYCFNCGTKIKDNPFTGYPE